MDCEQDDVETAPAEDCETARLLRRIVERFHELDVVMHAVQFVFPGGFPPSPRELLTCSTKDTLRVVTTSGLPMTAFCLLVWRKKSHKLNNNQRAVLAAIFDDSDLRSGLQSLVEEIMGMTDLDSILDCVERHEDTCMLLTTGLDELGVIPMGRPR